MITKEEIKQIRSGLTQDRDELIEEFAIKKFKEKKAILSIENAKHFKTSFKNRLKKAIDLFDNLQAKLEWDGLSEQEFDQKDELENEIEELREIINKLEKK